MAVELTDAVDPLLVLLIKDGRGALSKYDRGQVRDEVFLTSTEQ